MKQQSPNYGWYERVEELTRWLVSIPSLVGTPGEAICAQAIADHLSTLPYFQVNPTHLRLERTLDDPHERYSVIAFVRGHQAPQASARTVLLMGHLDTVDINDYGPYMHLACSPDQLAQAVGVEEGYMVGRGSLDMKSGAAAHLAVLERFSEGAGPQELCLLLAITPDEEDSSKGILSLVSTLPDLSAAWEMQLVGAINSDYTAPRHPGDEARYIYTGTIGKLLPSVFVAGLETHAGEPFAGFDPNWLMAEVTRRIDYNPDLVGRVADEVTPPPVSLKVTDRKERYSVQTALYSWAYFNWFTLTESPDQVLHQFKREVQTAFADLHAQFMHHASKYGQLTQSTPFLANWQPQVYTFDEVVQAVRQRIGVEYERMVGERLLHEPGIELRVFSGRMTEELWKASGLPAPAAVVGFAQIYSPPWSSDPGSPLVQAANSAAQSIGRQTGHTIHVRRFFPYISDISFLGCPDDPAALEALKRNSPGWGWLYKVDHDSHRCLNLPVLNIGPWGTGAHTRAERVEMAYSFGLVPELIWRTLDALKS
jgi:arginine utilization protein RocB